MTHTLGPWEARGCEIVGDSRFVATVNWCSGLEQEDEANRRLIAAAPDLLEAAREAAQHCASCDGSGMAFTHPDETQVGQAPGSSGIKCPECYALRAAIAKATPTVQREDGT